MTFWPREREFVWKVVGKRNVAFTCEVTFVVEGLDPNLFVDYFFGLPMLGWARHSPVMLQRKSTPPEGRPTIGS